MRLRLGRRQLVLGAAGLAAAASTRAFAQQPVSSIVELVRHDPAALAGACVEVLGYAQAGDGGGGAFCWDPTAAAAPDGGTVLASEAAPAGRWLRQVDGDLDVRWFGAKGDAATDDHAAFRAAQAVATAAGGGTIRVPPTASGYLIGNGEDTGSTILPTTGTSWLGDGTRLIHRARAADRRPLLMVIEDGRDIRVAGFEIASGTGKRAGILLRGVIERIALEDLGFVDLDGYSIVYGDRRTDPDQARYTGLTLERIAIRTRLEGRAEITGINIFPRSQRGDRPASADLVIRDLDVDVSNGSDRVRDHGLQGLKLSNTDGVVLEGIRVTGGRIGGVTITNGCRAVTGRAIACTGGSGGLQIIRRNNTSTTATQDVVVDDLRYVRGAARGDPSYGVAVLGDIAQLRMQRLYLEGGDLAFVMPSQQRFAIAGIQGPAAKNDMYFVRETYLVSQTGASGRIAAAAEGVLAVTPAGTATFDAGAIEGDGIAAGRRRPLFTTGSKVIYDARESEPVGGLSDGSEYWVIRRRSMLALAASREDALAGRPIRLSPSSGRHALHPAAALRPHDTIVVGTDGETGIELGERLDVGAFDGPVLRDIEIVDGSLRLVDPGTSSDDIVRLDIDGLRLESRSGRSTALILATENRVVRDSRFANVTAIRHPGAVIQVSGSGNHFERIVSVEGNPEAADNSALVVDRGDGNSFRDLALTGDHHVAAFIRKTGDGHIRVERLCGTPDGPGLIFADAGAPLPEGDVAWASEPLDPGDDAAFFTADAECWILGIEIDWLSPGVAGADRPLVIRRSGDGKPVLRLAGDRDGTVVATASAGDDAIRRRALAAGEQLIAEGPAGGRIAVTLALALAGACPMPE